MGRGRAIAGGLLWLALCSPAVADDADAVCRVIWAEAGNQPLAGKVAVLEVIRERQRAGGLTAEQVVSMPGQFEPVTRAGGWQRLLQLTDTQRAECDTILKLEAGEKIAPGADHFQNPATVAERARRGLVSPALVDFGGMPVVAEVGNHRFYRSGKSEPKAAPARPGMASMFASQDLDVATAQPE